MFGVHFIAEDGTNVDDGVIYIIMAVQASAMYIYIYIAFECLRKAHN